MQKFQEFFRFGVYNTFYIYPFAPDIVGISSDRKIPKWKGVNQKSAFREAFSLLYCEFVGDVPVDGLSSEMGLFLIPTNSRA